MTRLRTHNRRALRRAKRRQMGRRVFAIFDFETGVSYSPDGLYLWWPTTPDGRERPHGARGQSASLVIMDDAAWWPPEPAPRRLPPLTQADFDALAAPAWSDTGHPITIDPKRYQKD